MRHEAPRFALKPSGEISRNLLQRRDRRIKGLLSRNSLAALYGAPGSLKSLFALDLAYHVAREGIAGDAAQIAEQARELEQHTGTKLALVIVDTAAFSFSVFGDGRRR